MHIAPIYLSVISLHYSLLIILSHNYFMDFLVPLSELQKMMVFNFHVSIYLVLSSELSKEDLFNN